MTNLNMSFYSHTFTYPMLILMISLALSPEFQNGKNVEKRGGGDVLSVILTGVNTMQNPPPPPLS